MPPRTKGSPEPEEDACADEAKRLMDRAMSQGVLSGTRRIATSSLPPTKAMIRAGGKDIVKRGSQRRGRYLLVLNCQLAPAAAGQLGTLAALDSRNPVMYIDFPQGRLKLFGTLVFPRNKYVVLRLGAKEVVAEDVLESMIVFSEAWWVGRAEDNPSEARLPMPPELASCRLHDKYDFAGPGRGAAATGAQAGTQGAEDEAAAEDEDEADAEEPASQRPVRRATRHAGGRKRQRYNEDSDASLPGEDEEGGSDEEPALQKLPRLSNQRQRAASQPASRQPTGYTEDDEIDLVGSSNDDEQPLAKRPALAVKRMPATGNRARGAASRSTAAAKQGSKRRQKADGIEAEALRSESGAVADLVMDEDEEAGPSQRPRSTRKAAGVASRKLRVVDESSGGEGSSRSDDGEVGGNDSKREESEIEEASSEGGGPDYVPSD